MVPEAIIDAARIHGSTVINIIARIPYVPALQMAAVHEQLVAVKRRGLILVYHGAAGGCGWRFEPGHDCERIGIQGGLMWNTHELARAIEAERGTCSGDDRRSRIGPGGAAR